MRRALLTRRGVIAAHRYRRMPWIAGSEDVTSAGNAAAITLTAANASAQPGDLLVVFLGHTGHPGPTVPAGWTSHGMAASESSAGSGFWSVTRCYSRVMQAGDTAWTWTLAGAGSTHQAAGVLIAVRDGKNVEAAELFSGGTGVGTAFTGPALVVPAAARLTLVAFTGTRTSTSDFTITLGQGATVENASSGTSAQRVRLHVGSDTTDPNQVRSATSNVNVARTALSVAVRGVVR